MTGKTVRPLRIRAEFETQATVTSSHRGSSLYIRSLFHPDAAPWVGDLENFRYEWRRLFCELFGTFLLVLVAAGSPVVSSFSGVAIGRVPSVVAPGLMVMAIILSMGSISGAHLNPVVSVAFALRKEFPWRRIPAYVAAQLAGACAASAALWALFGRVGSFGATVPGARTGDIHAFFVEAILTLGLLTVILGTASGAQNVGPLSAIAVGGYIALAGIWASPLSGASMNPARSFGPDAILGHFPHFWVYVAGPLLGAVCAVGAAIVLRGPGGDLSATRAAEGTLGVAVNNATSTDSPALPGAVHATPTHETTEG